MQSMPRDCSFLMSKILMKTRCVHPNKASKPVGIAKVFLTSWKLSDSSMTWNISCSICDKIMQNYYTKLLLEKFCWGWQAICLHCCCGAVDRISVDRLSHCPLAVAELLAILLFLFSEFTEYEAGDHSQTRCSTVFICYFLTNTLVAEVEQSVCCACVSVYLDDKFWRKWPLT